MDASTLTIKQPATLLIKLILGKMRTAALQARVLSAATL